MNTILRFFRISKGKWLLVPAAFLLCALLPEYIAPVLAAASVIANARFKGKDSRMLFGSIGICVMIFISWQIIGLIYSDYLLSGLTFIAIWVFMFFGYLAAVNAIDNRRRLDTVIFAGAISGGIAGGIGIFQIFLHHYGAIIDPALKRMFNPFWHPLDTAVAKLAVAILPKFIVDSMPRQTFVSVAARASGTFTNPLPFATFLVMMMPFAAYCLLYFTSKRKKLLSFVCLILIFGGVASSYSRGPYLALFAAFFVLLFYGKKRTLKLMGLGSAMLAVLMVVARGVFKRLLTLFSNSDISINTRSEIWDACLEMLKDKWLFGYGTGVFNVGKILNDVYKIKQPHAHNVFLEFWLENGLFGLLIFAAIFIVFAVKMFGLMRKGERERGFAITLLSSIAGFLACGMTDYSFYGMKTLQYLMLILGLAAAAVKIYSATDEIYDEDDSEFSGIQIKNNKK